MEGAEKAIEICLPKRGVTPSFRPCHVFKTLKLLYESSPLGRPYLMRELRLGEASTKTLLKRLREAGLIRSAKPEGSLLTEKGLLIAKELLSSIYVLGEFPALGLCNKCVAWAASLKGKPKLIEAAGGVVRIRDLMVREGALGGLILKKKNGKIYMPSPNKAIPFGGFELVEELERREEVEEGDVVMVALCSFTEDCECLLINSALNLLRDLDC